MQIPNNSVITGKNYVGGKNWTIFFHTKKPQQYLEVVKNYPQNEALINLYKYLHSINASLEAHVRGGRLRKRAVLTIFREKNNKIHYLMPNETLYKFLCSRGNFLKAISESVKEKTSAYLSNIMKDVKKRRESE